MRCILCGKPLPDGAERCPNCGSRRAPASGPDAPPPQPPQADAAFFDAILSRTGEDFPASPVASPPPEGERDGAPSAPQPEEPVPPAPPVREGAGRRRRPALLGCGAAGLAALVFLLVYLLTGTGGRQPVFYLSGGVLYYLHDPAAVPISLADGVETAGVTVSENGKYAYFLLSPDGESVLYRAELDRLKPGPAANGAYVTAVDTGVAVDCVSSYAGGDAAGSVQRILGSDAYGSFHLSPDGAAVYYLTRDRALRRAAGDRVETVAEGILWFYASPDKSRLILVGEPGTGLLLLEPSPGAAPVLIAEEFGQIQRYSDDCSQIYYTVRDGEEGGPNSLSLYLYDDTGTTLLVSGISEVGAIAGPEDFAYLRALSDGERPLIDYVEDDMAAQDAQITGIPRQEAYSTVEAYQNARRRFAEKTARDELRRHLREQTSGLSTSSLYIRRDGADELVSDRLLYLFHSLDDLSQTLYVRLESASTPRLRLSEITSPGEVSAALWGVDASVCACIDAAGEEHILEENFFNRVRGITANGDAYLMDYTDSEATLYYCAAAQNYAQRREVLRGVTGLNGSWKARTLYCSTAGGDGTSTLYAVEEDVPRALGTVPEECMSCVYEDGALVLVPYSGGEQSLIYRSPSGEEYEAVSGFGGFARLKGGRLLVLAGFDGETGTLCDWEEGRSLEVAKGVSGFCTFGGAEPVTTLS